MTRARSLSKLANSSIFTVDSDNNVGLNSTSPDAKLDVVGVISATSFFGSGSGLTGVASTDNIITGTAATFNNVVKVGTAITLDATSGIVTATQFSGNSITVTNINAADITASGTLTYEDVANVDSVGIVTARSGLNIVGGGLTVTGVSTFFGNIDLQDDDKILLGSSDDLEIYHGSGVSRIDNNVGDIRIRNFADDAKIKIQTDNGSGSHTDYIICDGSNGETQLYYYGSEKLNTSNTGVTVTGTLAATAVTGDGSGLTGIAVGLNTAAASVSGIVTTLDLSSAQDHKLTVSGISTITVKGGTEGESHTVRIINSGITTVGFSTFFLFPSGADPSMPTADGAISLISFTVNRVGAGGTQLLAGAALNYS